MHIFISYAKKDTHALASQLHKALSDIPGITAWMDTSLETAESWAWQIQEELDQADYLVVLLSPDVTRPPTTQQRRSFVLNEIDYAQQINKPIIPIMAQRSRIPVQLAGVQYIDLTTDAKGGIDQLVGDIRRRANVQAGIADLRGQTILDGLSSGDVHEPDTAGKLRTPEERVPNIRPASSRRLSQPAALREKILNLVRERYRLLLSIAALLAIADFFLVPASIDQEQQQFSGVQALLVIVAASGTFTPADIPPATVYIISLLFVLISPVAIMVVVARKVDRLRRWVIGFAGLGLVSLSALAVINSLSGNGLIFLFGFYAGIILLVLILVIAFLLPKSNLIPKHN